MFNTMLCPGKVLIQTKEFLLGKMLTVINIKKRIYEVFFGGVHVKQNKN